MTKDMIKTIRNGRAYYIQKRIFELNVIGADVSERDMLQLSEVVIDIRNNEMVKCRHMLEDMFAGVVEQEFNLDEQFVNCCFL